MGRGRAHGAIGSDPVLWFRQLRQALQRLASCDASALVRIADVLLAAQPEEGKLPEPLRVLARRARSLEISALFSRSR